MEQGYGDEKSIEIYAFLDAYRKHECLWNRASDNYKNRLDCGKAYMEMIKDLNIQGLTALDVKRKINGVRSTYTRELRRLYKLRGQGRPERPRLFWFDKANTFLRRVCSIRNMSKTIKHDPLRDLNLKDYKFEYVEQDEDTQDHEPSDGELTDSFSPGSCSPHDMKIFPLSNSVTETPVRETSSERIEHSTTKHSATTQDTSQSIEEYNTSRTLIQDEIEVFGRSVAAQLRSNSDPYSRSVAKLKIQQILFEAETGQYKRRDL